MSLKSFSILSKSSSTSSKSRSGKSLSERIRDLGIDLWQGKRNNSRMPLQYMNIKTEFYYPSNVLIMTANLNLDQIVYYQPVVVLDKAFPKKKMYKIDKFETSTPGPKGPPKISDIEVKSTKPLKKMKFKKKKRHSSVIFKVEEILNRGKSPLPVRDPSEESLDSNFGQRIETTKGINDLPENILQKIFLNFDMQERNLILAKVCKFWYFLLKDPVFWTELQFSQDKVSTQEIIKLIKRYPSLKKLSLNAVPNCVEILQELCRCNHNITHLTVKRCPASSRDFARIILHVISCCKDLELLNVKGMQFHFDEFALELGRLKNLKSLNLTGNKLLRNQSLITMSLNFRALEELRIYDLNSHYKLEACLTNEDVALIISHLKENLRTLKMDMQLLKNLSFQAIIQCSELRCLGLKNCIYLSGKLFLQFSELKHLRKLKITRAINLKPEDFRLLFSFEHMHNIEDLDLSGCWRIGEDGIKAITQGSNALKYLSLKNCKSLTGKHLVYLSCCPNLIHLNIAHTTVEATNLLSLAKHAMNLQSLVIDPNMVKKSVIQHFRKLFPDIKLIVSCSEFRKCEVLLTDY